MFEAMSTYRLSKILLILAVAAIGALKAGGGWNELQTALGLQGEATTDHGTVTKATDGDTLKVRLDSGEEVSVRLIGIDSPETVHPDIPSPECGGPEASALMRRLAEGRRVRLESDPTQDAIDRYGRTLAYVTVEGDRLTLQERLLAAGYAETYIYGSTPFSRVDRFEDAEHEASVGGRGVWKSSGGDFHSAS